jgi:hypothetical protein
MRKRVQYNTIRVKQDEQDELGNKRSIWTKEGRKERQKTREENSKWS